MTYKFPPDRDIYTAGELASIYFNTPLETVDGRLARKAVKELARVGMLRAVCNRMSIPWPGSKNKYVMFSIRNHKDYVEYSEVVRHLAQHQEPGVSVVGPRRVPTAKSVMQAPDMQEPSFPEDRDLYMPYEVARAVLGYDAAHIGEARHATGVAVDRGWVRPINDRGAVRWPGGRVCKLYSVRNHDLYMDEDNVWKHLRGKTQPVPSAKSL